MKIYDCFMFNNEDLILDIRLNYLYDVVEKFILVESLYNHQGKKKKFFFDINKFSKYKNKIEYLLIENFPENLKPWERENYQRNYISNGFSGIDKNDYVMISDVDEIPNVQKIKKIENHKYTVFRQKNLYYKFNLLNKTMPFWHGTKICKKKYLKSPQWLRNQKVKKYSFIKFYKINWNIIDNGGWHFSYLMEPEKISEKLESFAHSEYNLNYYTNIERIKKLIKEKKDLFDREQYFEKIDIDNSYPDIIINNKNIYKNWII